MPPRPRTRWSLPWRTLRSYRRLGVRTNADTPKDATVVHNFGAEGIGLCHTGHMFFEGDRIDAVREMIQATDEAGNMKALQKINPLSADRLFGPL